MRRHEYLPYPIPPDQALASGNAVYKLTGKRILGRTGSTHFQRHFVVGQRERAVQCGKLVRRE